MERKEEQEAREAALREEMDGLVSEAGGLSALEARFLKDYGCVNFIGAEREREFALSREFHRRHSEAHPALHECVESEPYRCYHRVSCRCGWGWACDSSD